MKSVPLALALAALCLVVCAAPLRAEDDAVKTLDLSFQDTPLREALATLAEHFGKNLVVSPEVRGTVTLRMEGATWEQAIGLLAHAHGFHVVDRGNGIVTIAPSRRAQAAAEEKGRAAELRAEAERARARLAAVEEQRKRLAAQLEEEDARVSRAQREHAPALEAARARLAEANRKLEATRLERLRVTEENRRVMDDLDRLLAEYERLRATPEAPERVRAEAPHALGLRIYDVRDLTPGNHPELQAAVAAVVRAGGSVEERHGTLMVRASPEGHAGMRTALHRMRARRTDASDRALAESPRRAQEPGRARGDPRPPVHARASVEAELAELRREVRALRADVRDLTALVRKLLAQRER